MPQLLSARDYVRISEAASVLGVTEQTLRNWDKSGRLKAYRHPINGYRLYRVAELDRILDELDKSAVRTSERAESYEPQADSHQLPPCHWSPSVALDPKHRPQSWDAPSTTVRRDWRKYPQEAHFLSQDGSRYRRFSVEEIARLQGFDPEVVRGFGLTNRQAIAAVGDAVPPPLAKALARSINDVWDWDAKTAAEICAGMGGLAEGSASIDLEHLALVDLDSVAGTLLRGPTRPWPRDRVHVTSVKDFDFSDLGPVGLLSGGPPCQPWSRSGHGRGSGDDRDLLGWLPEVLPTIQPEVFAFENVPGLLSPKHRPYLTSLIERLRNPAPGLHYGALIARVNAADYGVPQSRRRILIVGFRDQSSKKARECFDRLWDARTHDNASAELPAWESVSSVASDELDSGEWRRWLGR